MQRRLLPEEWNVRAKAGEEVREETFPAKKIQVLDLQGAKIYTDRLFEESNLNLSISVAIDAHVECQGQTYLI